MALDESLLSVHCGCQNFARASSTQAIRILRVELVSALLVSTGAPRALNDLKHSGIDNLLYYMESMSVSLDFCKHLLNATLLQLCLQFILYKALENGHISIHIYWHLKMGTAASNFSSSHRQKQPSG